MLKKTSTKKLNPKKESPNFNAFTIAEVIITLGIIGIIAVNTIPTLIKNAEEKETITRVKKAYTTLSQAFKLAELENGEVSTWNWDAAASQTGANNALNALAKNLKIDKKCGTSTGAGCFPKNVMYKSLHGSDWLIFDDAAAYAKAKLSDGSSIALFSDGPSCSLTRGTSPRLTQSVCGWIAYDINGDKKPNSVGRDTFFFIVAKTGIIPTGTPEDVDFSLTTLCTKTGNPFYNGIGCTAWVISKENLNYQKSNVSW